MPTIVLCPLLLEIFINANKNQITSTICTIAEETLGHMPIEFSKIFSIFLQMGGIIECEVIGSMYNLGKGKGLEVPVDYRFIATRIKNIKNLCTARTALEKLKTRSDQIV